MQKSEFIDAIRSASDPDLYRTHHWSGTFGQYLDIVVKEPRIMRNAHQRLYDMLLSFGTEEITVSKEKLTKYKFFSDPLGNGRDAIFGLEKSLATLVDHLWLSGRTPDERERYQLATLVGISALALSNIPVWLLNITLDRPRPFVDHGDQLNLLFYPPTDPSFPANPVAIGFAAAAAAWSVNRKFGWWMFVAASLYGFSRLYAGVFYPTDIIGGAILGVAVFVFTSYLRRFLEPVVKQLDGSTWRRRWARTSCY